MMIVRLDALVLYLMAPTSVSWCLMPTINTDPSRGMTVFHTVLVGGLWAWPSSWINCTRNMSTKPTIVQDDECISRKAVVSRKHHVDASAICEMPCLGFSKVGRL